MTHLMIDPETLATGIAKFEGTRTGVHHRAIDDAIHQAKWVSNAWQALRGKKTDDLPS